MMILAAIPFLVVLGALLQFILSFLVLPLYFAGFVKDIDEVGSKILTFPWWRIAPHRAVGTKVALTILWLGAFGLTWQWTMAQIRYESMQGTKWIWRTPWPFSDRER